MEISHNYEKHKAKDKKGPGFRRPFMTTGHASSFRVGYVCVFKLSR
jgi:hypothetical protein